MVETALIHNRFAERLRADDAVLVIIDGQASLLSAARPCGAEEALRNNLVGLARLGHAFGLPTVLGVSAEAARGSVLTELLDLFGATALVRRRPGGFWDDPASRDAVLAHGRHHLIMASLAPHFGIAATALAARADGLEVHVVLDASAGSDDGAEQVGLARMTAAGVHLTGWVAVLAELSATGTDTLGGNGAAAVRDNLDRYAALAPLR
jgi:nicotinamidase-related amidase